MHGRDVTYSLYSLRDPSCAYEHEHNAREKKQTAHTLDAMTEMMLAVGTTTPWFSLHLKYRLPLYVPSVSPTEPC